MITKFCGVKIGELPKGDSCLMCDNFIKNQQKKLGAKYNRQVKCPLEDNEELFEEIAKIVRCK